MQIYGYGEDALTLAFLNDPAGVVRLFKEHLGVTGPVNYDRCSAYYRPSFGRGEGRILDNRRQATFGEFDAILQTPGHIALIESKWVGHSKSPISLHPHQSRRHAILQVYLESVFALGKCGEGDWLPRLLREVEEKLQHSTEHGVPAEGSALYTNLNWFLPQVFRFHKGNAPRIHHVVLCFTWQPTPHRSTTTGEIMAQLPDEVTLPRPEFSRFNVESHQRQAFVEMAKG